MVTTDKKTKSGKKQLIFKNSFIYTVLVIWALMTIYPFFWVIINSFKDKNQILSNSLSIPIKTFTFDNYINAFTNEYNIFKAYGNSLFVSTIVVVVVLIIAGFASYAMARYEFKGKKLVYGIIIATMMFPIFSIIFPLQQILIKLKLNGNRFGVILPQIAGNLGFAVVILSGFMQQLPIEVEESAYIDGANVFQILFRVVFPMSKSSFATTAIFIFLWSYNDLFLQMIILTDKDKMPIGALLKEISSKYGTDYGLMTASVSLIIIPVIIVYIILQKHIIKGLTAGAIKG